MNLRLRAATLVVCVATLILFSGTAKAYVLLGVTWPQPRMTYVVNPANLDLDPALVQPALQAGADAWRLQAGRFVFAFAGFTTQMTNTLDGVNLVVFRNEISGSAIATTYSWSSGSRIVEADIVFWDGGFRFFSGSAGCANGYYIEDVAAHEFGHALGLGHSNVAGATMFPSLSSCNQQARSLDPDDIAGVSAIYPSTRPSPPTGLRIIR
jgi:hypothetical protein